MLVSRVVYKFKCGGCNAKLSAFLKVIISEHLEMFGLTGERLKEANDSAI